MRILTAILLCLSLLSAQASAGLSLLVGDACGGCACEMTCCQSADQAGSEAPAVPASSERVDFQAVDHSTDSPLFLLPDLAVTDAHSDVTSPVLSSTVPLFTRHCSFLI